jgi:MFS family permease
MTAGPRSEGFGVGSLSSKVVLMLTIAIFINYVDRGNLSTAAPLLRDALQLSNTQIGMLLSAFYWSYTAAQIPAGWLGERIGASRLLVIGLVVWALSTALTGVAGGFASLLILRLTLGLGESVVYPCVAKLLSQRARENQRGGANGVITVGAALGTSFGTLAGGLLMARFGWRPVFIVFGIVSLGWLWLWRVAMRGDRHQAPVAGEPRPPSVVAMLKKRAMWGASIGHFSGSYGNYFITGWLPLFLVKERGYSMAGMAKVGAIIYLAYAVTAACTGWLSDRWIKSGASTNRVRKTVIVTGYIGVALGMVVCAFGGPTLSVAAMMLAAACFGLQTPSIHAIGQTLGGRAAGQWMGVQNCIANTSGIVGPLITGIVVDRTGLFAWAFAIAAGIAVMGAIAWGIIVPRIEAVRFDDAPAAPAPLGA